MRGDLFNGLRSRRLALASDPQQPMEFGVAVVLDDLAELVEALTRL
jgi:hypothetical protein